MVFHPFLQMNGSSRRIKKASFTWPIRVEIIILSALCAITFLPTFLWMWGRFTAGGSFYSHGPLIPLLALFLIWLRRGRLKTIVKEPTTAGLAIVLAALALHFLSLVTEIHFLSGLALIGVVLGISAYLFGLHFTRKIGPAIALLLFMVPMPRVFLIDTAFLLQLLSAKATVSILRAMGIHAAREGIYLLLPGGSVLAVDYACSGLRSLIVFIATAWTIIAMSPKIKASMALLVLAISIPMALASNVFRLVITALAAIYWSYSTTVHTLSGLVAFILYTIIMLLISRKVLWKEGY